MRTMPGYVKPTLQYTAHGPINRQRPDWKQDAGDTFEGGASGHNRHPLLMQIL